MAYSETPASNPNRGFWKVFLIGCLGLAVICAVLIGYFVYKVSQAARQMTQPAAQPRIEARIGIDRGQRRDVLMIERQGRAETDADLEHMTRGVLDRALAHELHARDALAEAE